MYTDDDDSTPCFFNAKFPPTQLRIQHIKSALKEGCQLLVF